VIFIEEDPFKKEISSNLYYDDSDYQVFFVILQFEFRTIKFSFCTEL